LNLTANAGSTLGAKTGPAADIAYANPIPPISQVAIMDT
jgi:hypothetical protein